MIVSSQKDFSEIDAMLKDIGARTVFLVGCGACATAAKTGGQAELDQATLNLEAAGYTVNGSFVAPTGCSVTAVRSELKKIGEAAMGADAIISYSCGAGVQAISEVSDIPAIPALNTDFLGTVMRIGNFEERCSACGECMLGYTAGICAVTKCPKSMLNGPCGGMSNGMCEVNPENECVHVQIYRKLKAQGRLRNIIVPAKSHKNAGEPGKVSLRPNRGVRSSGQNNTATQKEQD